MSEVSEPEGNDLTILHEKYGLNNTEAQIRVKNIFKKLINSGKISRNDNYFLFNIQEAVEKIVINAIRERQKQISDLIIDGYGLKARWGGDLTPGCQICLDGEYGLQSIRSVSVCNLNCPFCYYYNEPILDEFLDDHFSSPQAAHAGGRVALRIEDLKVIIDKQGKNLSGVCYVWYEPFTNIEKHYDTVNFLHKKGIHQHMYTNGTLCNEGNLRKLAKAGLDELRFNLAATLCSDQVINNMKVARKYFPYLVIESPMFPKFWESFVKKKDKILATGVDHINCAELHLKENNLPNYKEALLYWYKSGYCSPIFSRQLTYDMIEMASEENWDVTINDCSNTTKYYRGFVKWYEVGQSTYKREIPIPKEWYLDSIERYNIFSDGKISSRAQESIIKRLRKILS